MNKNINQPLYDRNRFGIGRHNYIVEGLKKMGVWETYTKEEQERLNNIPKI